MASPDQIYKDKFDTFYGGIPDDIRTQGNGYGVSAQHFDIFTNPKRLTPFRNMVADNGEDLTFSIINFLYANSVHYGQGVVSATARNKLFYKASDPVTGSWTAVSSGEASGGSRNRYLFIEFHNYIYLASSGTDRIQYFGDITGAPTFNETAYSLSGAGVPLPTGRAIITADDKLLIPCGRYIVMKDGAGSGPTNAWSVALTLPSSESIVDIVENGDSVSIATVATYNGTTISRVRLWDKVSSDVSQTIDFGEGTIALVEVLEGEIIGIISVGGNSAFGIRPRLVVRKWGGGTKAVVDKEIQADNNTTLIIYGSNCKVKNGNRVVFGATITINGTVFNQLMSYGRRSPEYPQALTFDRLVDNDTALTGAINGVGKIGDFYWIAHNDNGSVNRTNDQNAFTNATAVYITPKINGENRVQDAARRDKSMVMGGIITAPLTTGQAVSLYYRKDGTTSWTLVRTYSYGDDSVGMGFESGNVTGGVPFDNFREGQFKAVATGGAEILAIIYAWKLVGAGILSE